MSPRILGLGQSLIRQPAAGGGAPAGPVVASRANVSAWYELDDNLDSHWMEITPTEYGSPVYTDGAMISTASTRLKFASQDGLDYIKGDFLDFTILVRVKDALVGNADAATHFIFAKYHASSYASWRLEYNSTSGKLTWRVYYVSGSNDTIEGGDLSLSGDDVIVCGRDSAAVGSELFLYLNDNEVVRGAATAASVYNHQTIAATLSGNTNGGLEWIGPIKQAAFFRRAFSADEAAWYLEAERVYSDLAFADQPDSYGIYDAYQISDANDGDTAGYSVLDQSANGKNLSLLGTPTYKTGQTPDSKGMGATYLGIARDTPADGLLAPAMGIVDADSLTLYCGGCYWDVVTGSHYVFDNRDGVDKGFVVYFANAGNITITAQDGKMTPFVSTIYATDLVWGEFMVSFDETAKRMRITDLLTGEAHNGGVGWTGNIAKANPAGGKFFSKNADTTSGSLGRIERFGLFKGVVTREEMIDGHINPARAAVGQPLI